MKNFEGVEILRSYGESGIGSFGTLTIDIGIAPKNPLLSYEGILDLLKKTESTIGITPTQQDKLRPGTCGIGLPSLYYYESIELDIETLMPQRRTKITIYPNVEVGKAVIAGKTRSDWYLTKGEVSRLMPEFQLEASLAVDKVSSAEVERKIGTGVKRQ